MKNKNQLAKVCCLVLIVLIFSTSALFATECGDVNSDGKVNIVDALLTAKRYIGIIPPDFDDSVADMNSDGFINIVDALLMAQVYVGLIDGVTDCNSGVANLVPTRFSSPASSVPGGEVGLYLGLSVLNNGTAEAISPEGYIFIGFYLSKNSTLDSTDTLLLGGRESVVTPITVSQIKSVNIYDGMSIPEKTTPGKYYLLVVVDEMNTVPESNETDNLVARPITIGSGITDKITIFDAGGKEGALGGRRGADLLCTSYAGMQDDLADKEVRAFISVSASDEIRDMPSLYGVPTNLPIVSMAGKKIADNWADLLDGSIDMTLSDADILTHQFWYSGSNANGSLSDKNCTNWTSANGYLDGRYGRWVFTDANWITLGDATCGASTYHILGLAW